MVNVIICRNFWDCLGYSNEILKWFYTDNTFNYNSITYILSAVFLAIALKYLPLGVSYVIWVAFGIIGTSILGVLLFSEKLTLLQIISILLIILGVIGLKIFAK